MIKPDKVVSTVCPYCGVGCNMELHVRTISFTRSLPHSTALSTTANLCVKGRFGYDFIYHPKRITTPLLRVVAQQAGSRTQAFERPEWREVSWDEALDYTASRLVEIYRRDGRSDGDLPVCQSHKRRQLPSAKAMAHRIPHQQHRPLHRPVPRRISGRPAAGDRFIGDEQYCR